MSKSSDPSTRGPDAALDSFTEALWLEEGLSQNTLAAYGRDLRHFARWLKLFRETAEELCPPDVAALFVERAERIGYNFRLRIAQFRGQDLEQVKPIRAGDEAPEQA